MGGHRHIIEYLHDNGYLKASSLTASGQSALHLLNFLNVFTVASKGCDSNQIDSNELTALHHASMRGNIEVLQCIASTNSRVSKTQHITLYLAIVFGHLPIVKYLVLGGHCINSCYQRS